MNAPPGIMISAPSSGAGKTTVTLGLLRALADAGLNAQPFKNGPDYIDPAFHRAAARRESFNLDCWSMDQGLLASIATASAGADIVVAEGSMGLYDGVAGNGMAGDGSSAAIAKMMGWPAVLVVDVGGQAQSAAATALGFKHYDPDLKFAGVILNRVASPRHERLARLGMDKAGITVFGSLPRRGDLAIPERHLGLVQAVEHPDLDVAIRNYAAFLSEHVDIRAIQEAASSTANARQAEARPVTPPGQRIALAQDAAFSFVYPHLIAGWRAAGAEIIRFSPLANEQPAPDADVVWLPGGYPELHGGALANAKRFQSALATHAETRPVHGECGGYMALGAGLIDKEGVRHQMAGLLGLVTSYEKRRLHLGYRRAQLNIAIPGDPAGAVLRGHEHHYSAIVEQPDAPLANVTNADGDPVLETGSVRGNVTGSFFHMIAAERE